MYTALKKALEYWGPLLHNFAVDLWRSSCWLNTEHAEPSANRFESKILLPMGEYWVLYNK
jgi:hypothetical protein